MRTSLIPDIGSCCRKIVSDYYMESSYSAGKEIGVFRSPWEGRSHVSGQGPAHRVTPSNAEISSGPRLVLLIIGGTSLVSGTNSRIVAVGQTEAFQLTKTRQKKIPAEERKNVTVEAVIDLAGSTNPDAITTAAIAKHMKLTQGAIFRHFPNKDAIWAAVIDWVTRTLMTRIDSAARDIESPVEKMEAMFLAHIGFVSEHPGAPRMLFGELQAARKTPAKRLAQSLMAQYGARLHDLIMAGKTNGELRDDLDVEAASTLFIGTIQGLVMQSLIAGDMKRMRADAPRVFAIYLRGIAKAPATKTA